MQEPLIEYFFSNKHNGSHKNIKVQIIDYCDTNNPERREDFWIYHLDTIFPQGLKRENGIMILIFIRRIMFYDINFGVKLRKFRDGSFSYFMVITFRNCFL